MTPEQLKGKIRNISKKDGTRPQEVLQMFLFEKLLERLSKSKYRNNFILKGGLLISSFIGIGERTTLDMDTTVIGIEMEEKHIIKVIKEIIEEDIKDGVVFEYVGIEPIRDEDYYNNYRVNLRARFGKIDAPMKIDITTGDVIVPSAIQYNYPTLFENKTISIMAYSIETVLAEKFETIISRNISTTRARDFYDLHILFKIYKSQICMDVLENAVLNTAKKRNSIDCIREWKNIIKDLREESKMYALWNNYRNDNLYIGDLNFDEVLDTLEEMAKIIKLITLCLRHRVINFILRIFLIFYYIVFDHMVGNA